ncbi:MAG: hypothetical protein ABI905_04720 [Betaproteobacteria bacterium]
MRRNPTRFLFSLFCALVLAGCAGVQLPSTTPAGTCEAWLGQLDALVDSAGVRDAEAHRPAGFAYLRSNRLLASFAGEASGNEKFRDWIDALRALDQQAREVEIANLPAASMGVLEVAGKAAAFARALQCGNNLAALISAESDVAKQLRRDVQVPDSYSTAARAVGLYAISSIPFFAGVSRWQQETEIEFWRIAALGVQPNSVTYQPSQRVANITEATSLVQRAKRNSLGIPQFDKRQQQDILAAFAPVFEIETLGDDDRPGTLVWKNNRDIAVETQHARVYQRLAYTRFNGEVLPQLVYTIWFSRRPKNSAIDLLGGELDGVTVRITLDRAGRPLLADSIHACGCYQMFFPDARLRVRPTPEARSEWAFVPALLPAGVATSPLLVRLAARTHYVTGIDVATKPDGTKYELIDEQVLRKLPAADGTTRSIFGGDGLIAGSERAERFLFWPMGIASAGAMRQWGNHATAFVGRRHFDDADLLEKRFEIVAGN